jgi:uncharacterized membrane protein YfcA
MIIFLGALFFLGVIAGATAAIVGFGIGSLLTPFLLTRLSPTLAVAAVALPHLAATALRFVQHRHAIDKKVLARFGVASAAGGLAGAWLQTAFDEKWLFVVLGVLLIATALANLTDNFGGWQAPAFVAMALGGLSGLFGGLVGNQGGLRAAGLLAFNLSKRAYLATGTAVALMIDAARTPVYLARAGNELTAFAVPIVVATGGCILGTVLGERVFLGLAPERYRRIVGTAVGALGAWLLARALTF